MRRRVVNKWLQGRNSEFLDRTAEVIDPIESLQRVMATSPRARQFVAEQSWGYAPPHGREFSAKRFPRWALIAVSACGAVAVVVLMAMALASPAREETLDERLDTAIGELSSVDLDVRMKSVDELEDIAREHPEHRRRIFEELTRWVRDRVPVVSYQGCARDTVTADVGHILRVIMDSGIQPDLTGAESNFTIDLSKVCLAGVGAPGASLSGVDLSYSYMYDADFREATFARGNLTGSMLEEADLTGADLNNVVLVRATLRRAVLAHAKLSYTNLVGVDLSESTLTQASLFEADLTGASLRGANLADADLRGAKLVGADLTGADLTGANTAGADLSGAKGISR
ncbi:MAG TPA: pentapeptide repeat-containing protein [Actinophytocola sp.]|uniref:pentapeptide repeat-containing protein n=1 Tax=Actinophytocola sp. TaxID=1872138 RepID=UPI002DDCB5C1|nr:pentapeptide repeat-containing protein [Actinophytocola sp.]HEV2779015.1 pentapeptide repeat-containing protein [Actinophytocola sp.]